MFFYCVPAPKTLPPDLAVALAQTMFGRLLQDAARKMGSPVAVSVLESDQEGVFTRQIPTRARVVAYVDVFDTGECQVIENGPGLRGELVDGPKDARDERIAELERDVERATAAVKEVLKSADARVAQLEKQLSELVDQVRERSDAELAKRGAEPQAFGTDPHSAEAFGG